MIFLRLICSYIIIGLFGFGGGYAMLALIENQVVTPGWISEKTFTDIVAISQMTPGPIGINSATYIGYAAPQTHGFPGWYWGLMGSVICTLTVVLPTYFLVRYSSRYINRHRESVYVRGALAGLRPVIVGLIASAAMLLMNSANFGSSNYEVTWSIILCIGSLCISMFTKIHPIVTIILAGICGLIIY